MRIQQQIFYSFLFIFSLVFGLATWMYFIHFNQTLQAIENQQVTQINSYIQKEMQQLIQRHDDLLATLDKDGDVASAYDEVAWVSFIGQKFVSKSIEDLFKRHPYLQEVSFLKGGKLFFKVTSKQRPVLQAALLDKEIELNITSGRVIYKTDLIALIQKHLSENRLDPRMRIYLHTPNGNWLIARDQVVTTDFRMDEAGPKQITMAQSTYQASIPTGNRFWQIRSLKPQDDIQESLRQFLLKAMIAYGVSSILIFIIARYLSAATIRPLSHLEAASHALMNGEYTPIRWKKDDEVKPVIDAFNLMGHKIQGFTQELQSQVQMRTRELEAANAELALRNETDALTNARNRHFLTHQMPHLIKLANRNDVAMGLAMMDLDHFKILNDTYGHLVGDECLIAFVNHMFGVFRRDNDWIIRYGGEEFCLICFSLDEDAFKRQLEYFRRSIENMNVPIDRSRSVNFTVSIGYTHYKVAPEEWHDDLVEKADALLYQAKKSGRNIVIGESL